MEFYVMTQLRLTILTPILQNPFFEHFRPRYRIPSLIYNSSLPIKNIYSIMLVEKNLFTVHKQ